MLGCLSLSDAGISGSNCQTTFDLAHTDDIINFFGNAGICIRNFPVSQFGLFFYTKIGFQDVKHPLWISLIFAVSQLG